MQKIIIIIIAIIIAFMIGLLVIYNVTVENKNNYFQIDLENELYLFPYFSSSHSSIVKNQSFDITSNIFSFDVTTDTSEKFTIFLNKDFLNHVIPEDEEFDPFVLINGIEVGPIVDYDNETASITIDVNPTEQEIKIILFTFDL